MFALRHSRRLLCPHLCSALKCIAPLALVLTLFLTPPALAQGTMGMLPDPISSAELDGYMKRLQMSPQQQHAARAMHDQYKREFRELREGEIAEFLKVMRTEGMGMMPNRKTIEDMFKNMDTIARKIATIDNRFIDQLQPILNENQFVTLPRVKLARERAREYSQQMMWMAGEPPVDLSEVALEFEMTPEERATADSVMSGYETRLTGLIREMRDVTTKMVFEMYDAMEKLGVNEESMADPEQMEKVGQAMEQLWKDLAVKPMEVSKEIGALNRRSVKSVVAMLPPETARNLRDAFYRRSYEEASFALLSEARSFTAALASDALAPEQREAILALRADYRQKMDSVLEETVNAVIENRGGFSPFDFDSEKMQKHQERLAELRTQATDIAQSALTSLNAALGPDLVANLGELRLAVGDDEDEADHEDAPAIIAEGQQLDQEALMEDGSGWSGDQYLPSQINRAALEEYAALLGLSDEQKSIARELHANYRDAFKTVTETEIAAVTEATQAMWKYDEATGSTRGPDAAQIDAIYRQRATALEAIVRTDAAFLDNLELILEPEQTARMQRVRLARARERWNVGSNWGMWGGTGSSESQIDIAKLIRGQHLAADVAAPLDAALLAYDEKAAAAFKERYEAQLVANREQEKFSAEMMKAQQDGEGGAFAAATRFQEQMREVQKRLSQANAAVGALNRESLEALLAKLPAEAGNSLRTAFNKQAFPQVYNDAGSPQQALENALKLDDLTAEQQRRLGEVAAEYRTAYADFCEQMVEASTGSEAMNYMMGADEEAWAKYMERQEVISKIAFDRSELNARAASQLRSVLSESQLTRIGNLPVPEEGNPFEIW